MYECVGHGSMLATIRGPGEMRPGESPYGTNARFHDHSTSIKDALT